MPSKYVLLVCLHYVPLSQGTASVSSQTLHVLASGEETLPKRGLKHLHFFILLAASFIRIQLHCQGWWAAQKRCTWCFESCACWQLPHCPTCCNLWVLLEWSKANFLQFGFFSKPVSDADQVCRLSEISDFIAWRSQVLSSSRPPHPAFPSTSPPTHICTLRWSQDLDPSWHPVNYFHSSMIISHWYKHIHGVVRSERWCWELGPLNDSVKWSLGFSQLM